MRLPRLARQAAVWLLRAVAAGLVAVVGARLLGLEQGSYASFAMAALPVLLAAAYPLLVGAVLLRQQVLAALALVLAGAHVLLVAPSTGDSSGACAGTPLRVVGANLLKLNPEPERAGAVLLGLHPDVLVLPELTSAGRAGLAAAGVPAALPFALLDPRAAFDTTGLLSRLPLMDQDLHPVSGQLEPRATVDVGGVPLRILGEHPQPPLTGQAAEWVGAMDDLGDELQGQTGAAVALGDFNAGRDLASFRALLTGGVRDAHEEVGRGLAPTWPAGTSIPPFLHLDHVLVQDGDDATVSVCSVREVEVPGSDHLAVVADLAVARRGS